MPGSRHKEKLESLRARLVKEEEVPKRCRVFVVIDSCFGGRGGGHYCDGGFDG